MSIERIDTVVMYEKEVDGDLVRYAAHAAEMRRVLEALRELHNARFGYDETARAAARSILYSDDFKEYLK